MEFAVLGLCCRDTELYAEFVWAYISSLVACCGCAGPEARANDRGGVEEQGLLQTLLRQLFSNASAVGQCKGSVWGWWRLCITLKHAMLRDS